MVSRTRDYLERSIVNNGVFVPLAAIAALSAFREGR